MKKTALYLIAMAVTYTPMAGSQDIPLERCQYLQEKIDYYSKLRKKGGSASQMEAYRKARGKYAEEFREGDCHKYPTSVR